MFERFHREAPFLQAYGKLPLAKDYLRVGASQGHARALREWLDLAYSSNVAARNVAPSLPWPARFVLGLGNEEPVMGSMWASSDRGGERPFPFALFLERRRKALLSELGEELGGWPGIWSSIESCYEKHRTAVDGESYLAWMREQAIPIAKLDAQRLERIRWETWVQTLWPEEGQAELLEILVSLARLALVGHRGPVRLPIVCDLPVLPQVHAWWTALSTSALVARTELPSLFFPQAAQESNEPSFCTFFLAPLVPGDAAWIAPKRTLGDLGDGDFIAEHPRRSSGAEPSPENVPLLAESMRGAVATARARTIR